MDRKLGTVVVLVLLSAVAEVQTFSPILDVCATCHPNATCDDKSDGSGKVCNCMYGFVGNGRTLCQDKDECQIGAIRICGQHTSCHNTYGSYFCTCLSGYSPSNNMPIFIPNDGTSCQDIDECRIPGLCGEGGRCRNLEGSFDCRCQVGYRVHGGGEPFHPQQDSASCKVVDCGQRAPVEDAVLLNTTGTTYGSVALFSCDHGFVWRSGDHSSTCEANGTWVGPSMVCEEVDCGSPPAPPHSHPLWNGSSRLGSEVIYQCDSGYHDVDVGGRGVSTCTISGRWESVSVRCEETVCGTPPVLKHTERVWSGDSTPGNTVRYFCKEGFYNKGGDDLMLCNDTGHWTQPTISCKEISCGDPPLPPHTGRIWNGSSSPGTLVFYYCIAGFHDEDGDNVSSCMTNGYWTRPNISCREVDCGVPPNLPRAFMLWEEGSTVQGSQAVYRCQAGFGSAGEESVWVCAATGEWEGASPLCQEIKCGKPIFKPHAKVLWDNATRVGSVVYYQCEDGFHTASLRNSSVCGENGMWEDIDLSCEELSCGPPLTLPYTNLLWDGTTRPGSVAVYVCVDGFYRECGHGTATCSETGEWGKVSLKCKALCSPAPVLPNSQAVLHNRSVVVHSCVEGFHSWRGSNVSVCDKTGHWQKATMRCIEIKPAVNYLAVSNEKCLQWKAEKYEGDTEVYMVRYIGSREYQRSFHDERRRLIRSMADRLEICLSLLPVTNYTISVTAVSARFTATVTTNTSMQAPPAPVIFYREVETPLPTLRLQRSTHTLDPISVYQVFVLPLEGTTVFDCTSPESPDHSVKNHSLGQYITAQFHVTHVSNDMNFTVGDGLPYNGFLNAPLEYGRDYYIVLRAASYWKGAFRSTCVLWAKVRGTSYAMRISSLLAAGSVGLVAVIALVGYTFAWFFKRT